MVLETAASEPPTVKAFSRAEIVVGPVTIRLEEGASTARIAAIARALAEADRHGGLWPYGNRPMTDKMLCRYISKHTEQRLDVAISPHGFRRAAATFITEADPVNIRMGKDLLGHKSFAMTEKHYIHAAGSRLAGHALEELIMKAIHQ